MLWSNELKEKLLNLGFKCLATHESILILYDESNKPALIIGTYVDDLLIGYKDLQAFHKFVDGLRSAFPFKVQEGNCINHLGANIHQSKPGVIFMEQEELAKDIVESLRLDGHDTKIKLVPLPADASSVSIDDGVKLSKELHKEYRSAVGKIGYLCYTRPDLLFARHFLSRFLHSPTDTHWKHLIHVGKYIKGTPSYGLPFFPSSDKRITGYTDSDFATNKDDRKSISGGLIFCGRNLVQADCDKQQTPANSSTDAELRACSSLTRQVKGMRDTLELIDNDPNVNAEPSEIHIDNQGCIYTMGNVDIKKLVKHLSVDIALMRSYKDNGWTKYIKIDTENNISDMLTKPLAEKAFTRHRDTILLQKHLFLEHHM
jgi:hypothetical protein